MTIKDIIEKLEEEIKKNDDIEMKTAYSTNTLKMGRYLLAFSLLKWIKSNLEEGNDS